MIGPFDDNDVITVLLKVCTYEYDCRAWIQVPPLPVKIIRYRRKIQKDDLLIDFQCLS